MAKLIKDKRFKVVLDHNASSPQPARAIWTAQHATVTDDFAPDKEPPLNCSKAIIHHQLDVKHFSVLYFGFVKLDFGGFPHDAVMQMVRHQDSFPLVQSMRYTGAKMAKCGSEEMNREEVENLFYAMPSGKYGGRTGIWEYTERDRQEHLTTCHYTATRYARAINRGIPEEVARRSLAAGYRQNFTMAGTIKAVMHWLDQRTLADSQIECQTLAWMALDVLEQWEPGLFGWYRQHRAGKNLLAP